MIEDIPRAGEEDLAWRLVHEHWQGLKRAVIRVLEECIEGVRHAMRVDELRAGR